MVERYLTICQPAIIGEQIAAMISIDSSYNPKKYEKKWWDFWEQNNFFDTAASNKAPYTILMPPPNVTSHLHMGHGTTYTFQDLLIRWKRMQGYTACWLPGTDHAGIATQMMVEKDLEKTEGKTRKDIGREAFFARCQKWRDVHGGKIYQQFQDIGFSADWKRSAYTMDEDLSAAVRYVFVTLFKEGLIYRGERLVNWDTVLKTAVSDDELYSEEMNGHLWHLRYPVEGSDEQIVIATTRPETMLGDTAVAVHPDDDRYKHLVGRNIRLPICDRLIPIIADDYVKSDFGSGAVKITPAHDPNDFEIGKRHKLPFVEIFDDAAAITEVAPEAFRGLDRFVARKKVIKTFKELGLFEKEEHYKHSVPHSDRSKSIVEPKLSKQWYVRMKPLAEPAAAAARNGELNFFPKSWSKTYLYWLDNIQDWCISRQLWWGHQIPIWYCDSCDHLQTGVEDPTQCDQCGSDKLTQDPDVLDTWFSSWLWPLSPFGWPDEKKQQEKDLNYFYPSNVLITAPEIIFLWVARMVMAGLKFKGEVPFKDIYFTAVVTDKQGKKFSKTLGNGIDPLEIIDKHGADATRFTGVSMAPLGGRVMMDKSDFDHGARFVNKLWNASRFLFNYLDSDTKLKPISEVDLDLPSQWLLTGLSDTAKRVNESFSNYHLNDAVDRIYHFIWGQFCDWGLECAKQSLQSSDEQKRSEVLSVLVYALDGALRLAHPIMPFVTEELWQKLPHHPDWDRPKSIVVAGFPDESKLASYAKSSSQWQAVLQMITSVRSVRQQVGISPKIELDCLIKASDELVAVVDGNQEYIKKLANIKSISISSSQSRPEHSLAAIGKGFECYLPVAGLVDFTKERGRIEGEIKRITKIVDGISNKLKNKNFVERAPENVVLQTKEQLENMSGQLQSLKENLAAIG